MPDLKKLYTPKEAAVLYNSNKIRFNPTAYTLKEHLILNRDLGDLSVETISSYSYRAETSLFDEISDKEGIQATLVSKVGTANYDGVILPTEADCAAIKEYNLSIALDYLIDFCKIDPHKLKNSELMNAIVRMCIALDSVESCCKEMYWFITNLWDRPYTELHNFEHLKKALETKPIELPVSFFHNGIDVLQNDVLPSNTPGCVSRTSMTEQLREAVLYKSRYYTMEFLWAYLRLDDPSLKRAIAWCIENCGDDDLNIGLYTVVNSEIIIDKEIEDIVKINNPADRFAAYQEYLRTYDNNILAWAQRNAPDSAYIPMHPVTAMFVGYAENIAVTHVRVNTLAILHTYCTEHGYIEPSTQDTLDENFEGTTGIGSMLGGAVSGDADKALMELEKHKGGSNVGGEAENSSKYNGNNGIFEALDKLDASFKDDKYTFNVKDVRVDDAAVKPAYEKVCAKVSLMNRNLIQKIRAIKTYNTGGKTPGVSTGKLDRKAMYRYKYDPNIFYNNTYKQLESDLAFGIILDQSGSMSGSGISNGKITMIVLHETLKALGINHSIIGHTSHGGEYKCDIERYQSFKEDKTYTVCKNYALVNLTAHACNCDSGALYYMEKAMDRVQNKDKIVLIFSDGYPTACSSTDLINQVHRMEKKGIKVIGIGVDFPSISKYYTDYANGRNLQDMLNIVTDILQEYILKKKVD